MDFRNQYRIVEKRWNDGSVSYTVHYKKWRWFFYRELKLSDWWWTFFDLPRGVTLKYHKYFETVAAADAFAHDHARRGTDAFFEKEYYTTIIELGRLP
jgi:hypothetical protein